VLFKGKQNVKVAVVSVTNRIFSLIKQQNFSTSE